MRALFRLKPAYLEVTFEHFKTLQTELFLLRQCVVKVVTMNYCVYCLRRIHTLYGARHPDCVHTRLAHFTDTEDGWVEGLGVSGSPHWARVKTDPITVTSSRSPGSSPGTSRFWNVVTSAGNREMSFATDRAHDYNHRSCVEPRAANIRWCLMKCLLSRYIHWKIFSRL